MRGLSTSSKFPLGAVSPTQGSPWCYSDKNKPHRFGVQCASLGVYNCHNFMVFLLSSTVSRDKRPPAYLPSAARAVNLLASAGVRSFKYRISTALVASGPWTFTSICFFVSGSCYGALLDRTGQNETEQVNLMSMRSTIYVSIYAIMLH